MALFVDRVTIKLRAGDGGNGCVSFHREKFIQNGGPDGGDGGKGGDIIILADPNMHTLLDFKYKTKYVAENGEAGQSNLRKGKDGESLLIKVPVGTVIFQKDTGLIVADMDKPNKKKVLLHGGRGGFGNSHFASSTRQAPNFAKPGIKNDMFEFIMELKTLADVGLVGFPNVGKSTILAALTRAKPKIANYHFTTLTPNLGIVQKYDTSFVLADIPGLVEGASEGKGLGHYFLRHIERTRLILNVIDISGSEGRDPYEDYLAINKELQAYGDLKNRPQVLVLNKSDLINDDELVNQIVEKFKSHGLDCFVASAATNKGLDKLVDFIIEKLKELPPIISFPQESEVYKAAPEKDYIVEKTEYGFEVSGDGIDRLIDTVNFSDQDSINWFHKMLENLGIMDELRAQGAKDGDSIKLGDMEFDFIE